MLRIAQILVPVDFSSNSLLAVRHAAILARKFRSEVTLLHVNEIAVLHALTGPLGYGISSPETVREEFLAHRRKELDAFGASDLSGVTVTRQVSCGDAARNIVERGRKADLILMPTHGYGPVRRLLLGSITAKVLHDSDRAVWTCRPESEAAHDPSSIRHVMCAVNLWRKNHEIVHWAADFARQYDARLTLVHAILPAPPEMPERYAFTWHGEARWGADEALHALVRELQVPAEVMVIEGDAPVALAAATKEHSADLLVIGRSHATNMIGRLGSHSYGIICHAPCPVVSL
ncbi:MAG: universal stress protein [Acidobacteriia bacterium]|nr:universal stress protein [Terriglobia bacterium]